MKVRGIRGAITVSKDTEEEIMSATTELLEEMIEVNNLQEENTASIFFSLTDDLSSTFPAVAARELGWNHAALFCCQELTIDDSLNKCIRVLIHYNTDKELTALDHVYLRRAKKLRPDLVEEGREENE